MAEELKMVSGRSLLQAQEEERATKAFGQPNGALGNVGLEILWAMLDEPGRVWTRASIGEEIKRSSGAVTAAIGRLRARGYLV